jgi:LmbE family N-acetylglucosaminyl deacetylase
VAGIWLAPLRSVTPPTFPGPAITGIANFGTLGSVLCFAAHPDDENTQVIAYLARGRGYRTAYLSLTRGDGGQNLLVPQLREQLGVARTQELLAARRIDGGRQYFSRANDFGFSKDYRETLQIWDRQAVLADIVRVIRTFRPDVIVTRFSPEPGPTHGHHTASVVLAVEAFKLAGDPQAFPPQPRRLTRWRATSNFHNVGLGGASRRGGRRGARAEARDRGNDPVSGESFAAIAARSRGMHKSKVQRGHSSARRRIEDRALPPPGGEPATRSPRRSGHDVEPRAGGRRDRSVDRGDARGFDPTSPRPACLRCWRFVAGCPRCLRTRW